MSFFGFVSGVGVVRSEWVDEGQGGTGVWSNRS
jgi:hypothetical protein